MTYNVFGGTLNLAQLNSTLKVTETPCVICEVSRLIAIKLAQRV